MSLLLNLLGFGLVQSAIFAAGTIGLTLQFGVSNYINFAYGEFLTFGALICWTLSESGPQLPLWVSLVLAVVATGLLSVVIQRFLFGPFVRRRPQLLFALAVTFAASVGLNNVWGMIWGSSYREMPSLLPLNSSWGLGPWSLNANDALYFLMAFVAILAVQLILFRTGLGAAMRAISDSAALARVSGLDVQRVTDVTWFIAGALGGLGGVLLAIETHTFTIGLGDSYLFLLFAAVIMGGIGKPLGALIGALIVGLATQVATLVVPSALTLVAVFALLVVILVVRPSGLLGTADTGVERER